MNIIHIKYILQIYKIHLHLHACVCIYVNMTKLGFGVLLRGSVLEHCWKRLCVSFPACHLLTPTEPHKSGRGPGIFPFRETGRPPAHARHSALCGSAFPCSGLAVCFFFCWKVCIIWPSGMPPAFCLSDPMGRGQNTLLARGEGCMDRYPASVFRGVLLAVGVLRLLLKLMLLSLLFGSKFCFT